MATETSRANLFDPKLVTDLITRVKGKSSLAALSAQEPIPFNGLKEFIFTLDNEVDIVAENGSKSHGGISVEPVVVIPTKIEYGARVSDEFMYATEEEQINILAAFNDGFSKKVARGIDLMAMHGVNPRTGQPSAIIGDNNFDTAVTQTVTYDATMPDDNIEAAVAMVHGSEGDVTGLAMSTIFASAMAKLKVNGVKQFPELSWGASPESINGVKTDVNKTVSDMNSGDMAIIGDFATMFKWGFAKEVPMEIIQYGDPDNTGKDLKGHNQVYLRTEMYIGWGILVPEAFAIVKEEQQA